ncbi:MAG: hypothetical protein LQ338_000953 [Usnochroma carphineum]|nr:MAG: hypothetical protein LQ338_000953 [Usnochroma carphineum]
MPPLRTKILTSHNSRRYFRSRTTLFQEVFNLTASRYRRVCQDQIFDNFESVTSKNIEGKLWDAHIRVNGRFRKRLAYFRGLKGKEKKPVERRKTAKLYLDFVKSSQRFYRGYIQRLVSLSGGIPELQDVAHRFSSDGT